MSFANWKKKSKVFYTWKRRADNYGIDLNECCMAAYKAGMREGMDIAVDAARRAAILRAAFGSNTSKE